MHGGARHGAGRPKGGISQSRRLLVGALHRGLEIAGRERGIGGDAEAVATETAAQIAADLIRAGRGDEVLKLLAVSQIKSDEGGDSQGETPLTRALKQLPGLGAVPLASQSGAVGEQPGEYIHAQSTTCDTAPTTCATDTVSVGRENSPFFLPQRPLFGGAAHPAAAAGEGATPPAAPPRPVFYLDGKNFEKNQDAAP